MAAAAESMTRRLGDLEEQLYQVRNRSGQDPLNFPIKLNNKLAALQRIVDSGDGRPPAQCYTVFAEQSAKLDALLSNLSSVIATDSLEVNKQLRRKRVPPLSSEPRPLGRAGPTN